MLSYLTVVTCLLINSNKGAFAKSLPDTLALSEGYQHSKYSRRNRTQEKRLRSLVAIVPHKVASPHETAPLPHEVVLPEMQGRPSRAYETEARVPANRGGSVNDAERGGQVNAGSREPQVRTTDKYQGAVPPRTHSSANNPTRERGTFWSEKKYFDEFERPRSRTEEQFWEEFSPAGGQVMDLPARRNISFKTTLHDLDMSLYPKTLDSAIEFLLYDRPLPEWNLNEIRDELRVMSDMGQLDQLYQAIDYEVVSGKLVEDYNGHYFEYENGDRLVPAEWIAHRPGNIEGRIKAEGKVKANLFSDKFELEQYFRQIREGKEFYDQFYDHNEYYGESDHWDEAAYFGPRFYE